MPIIEPKKNETFTTIKIKVNDETLKQIANYRAFAKFEGEDLSYFFEESAKFVLQADKEFQKSLK